MTHRHFLLRTNPADPRLLPMLLLSLIAHAGLLSFFIGSPPDATKKVYFSPVYTVSLVELPGGRAGGSVSGTGAGTQNETQGISLWKGPAGLSSNLKTIKKRSHSITISGKSKNRQAGDAAPRKSGGGTSSSAAGGTKKTASGSVPTRSPEDLRFSAYYESVWNKIRAAWVLPVYGTAAAREAEVSITIDRSGKVLNMRFEKKSGDAVFDRSVLRAVKKADPLPPIPEGLRLNRLELGIRFTS